MIDPMEGSPNDGLDETIDDPLELQQWLVESSLDSVFEAYDEAVAEGMDRPIVILVDCEDELGGAIAREWLGDEEVDDAILMEHTDGADAEHDCGDEGCEGEGCDGEHTTIFALAASWDDARDDVSEAFPYLAPVFEGGPPEDGVLVISITAGGASALTAPFEARPDGEA